MKRNKILSGMVPTRIVSMFTEEVVENSKYIFKCALCGESYEDEDDVFICIQHHWDNNEFGIREQN